MQRSISLIEEISEGERENRVIGMEVQTQAVELDLEFWPLQHPMEPDDEDRPVICPMPHSSLLQDGRKLQGKRTPESWRRRAELSRVVKEEGNSKGVEAETPIRVVRKRHHHSLSRADHHVITPLTTMSSLPPLPTQDITIFQMLQHFDKFES